jgi:hypothetical protein
VDTGSNTFEITEKKVTFKCITRPLQISESVVNTVHISQYGKQFDFGDTFSLNEFKIIIQLG